MKYRKEYGLYVLALISGVLFCGCMTDPFPRQELNIRMETKNFTDNHPVINWDSHPDARHGYFLLVLTENKYNEWTAIRDSVMDRNRRYLAVKWNNNTGYSNSAWNIAWHDYTEDVSSRVFSRHIKFIPWDVSGIPFTPGPSILPGGYYPH